MFSFSSVTCQFPCHVCLCFCFRLTCLFVTSPGSSCFTCLVCTPVPHFLISLVYTYSCLGLSLVLSLFRLLLLCALQAFVFACLIHVLTSFDFHSFHSLPAEFCLVAIPFVDFLLVFSGLDYVLLPCLPSLILACT